MPTSNSLPRQCDILLLEDDAILRRRLGAFLRGQSAEVSEAGTLAEARRLLGGLRFDFALVDLHLPDGEALELLREGLFSENTIVVVMTAFGGVKQAVEAMRLGACDYLAKPFEAEELPLVFLRSRQRRTSVRREEHRIREAGGIDTGSLVFGPALQPLREQLDRVLVAENRMAGTPPPILIEGETGTGKSALARWIHGQGPRSSDVFLSLNCAAMPEPLAEAELFGHERGAFTDAKTARMGLFEAADGGTLFLDEIGALSPALQAKLLTAVEEGCIRRVGASKTVEVDVRLLAASNRPLASLVREGGFREDLYHRIHLIHLTIPPLRERGSDIVSLARHFLEKISRRHRLAGLEITASGESRLRGYPWPGNVRELAHEIERAVIFAPGPNLQFEHLARLRPEQEIQTSHPAEGAVENKLHWRNPAWRLPEAGFTLESIERELIAEALRETGGNVSGAARRLGVTREYLRYRIENRDNA